MKLNLIDRAIAAVAPAQAVARLEARARLEVAQSLPSFGAFAGDRMDLPSGNGGGSSLLHWWRPGSRDAAGDSLYALTMQRGQVRELVRTSPIAGGAISTNVNRVVGTGCALVAQPARTVLGWTQDQMLAWKMLVQTEFSLWADSPSCDWEGEQNFYDKQALTLRSSLEAGDCFTVMPDGDATGTQPYKLRLQTIEADRVGNPNNATNSATIAGGVDRSIPGGAKRYFVYDTHPGALYTLPGQGRYTGQWMTGVGPSGRRRLLHHFVQLRPEQPRGIPYLTPVIGALKQLSRYTEAEIQAAVVSAMFTVFVETPTAQSAPVYGTTDAQIPASGELDMEPGAVLSLAPNEKVSFADPSRPNTSFDPFVVAIIRQIGVGLNLPYELLIKQFNASYSASKAALLDAWMWFRCQRTWLARSFCQPIYENWLTEAVMLGRISAPGFFTDPLLRWAYSRAEWHGDSMGSINPKDEVAAYSAAVDARLMTRERAEWEMFGTDWYETYASKKTENDMLAADGLLPIPKAGAAVGTDPNAEPAPEPAPAPQTGGAAP